MLDLLGRGYVIDHVMASFRKEKKDEAFRTYITEGLRIITENTAAAVGGSSLSMKFDDVLKSFDEDEDDGQTAEQKAEAVINHLKEKLGG